MWYFHDGSPDNYPKTEPLGEGVLETVNVAEIEVLDDGGVAFLGDG